MFSKQITGLTATTNPAPGTGAFSVTNPFKTGVGSDLGLPFPQPKYNNFNWADLVSTAWTSQNIKALFPLYPGDTNFNIGIIPVGGTPSTATWTLTLWRFVLGDPASLLSVWGKPISGSSVSGTGLQTDYILTPGIEPIYFQVSALSGASSLTVVYDGGLARAL